MARRFAAAVAGVLALWALASPALPAQRPVNFQVLSVNPGLASRLRAGCSFPVAVELSVLTAPVSGTIAVMTESSGDGQPAYVTDFDISPGAAYLYHLFPYCQSVTDSYVLVIRDARGGELHREPLSMRPHEADSCLVAIVGQEGIPGIGYRPAASEAPVLGTLPAPVPRAFLPPRASGWDSADVIVWPHPDPAGLDTAQQRALREWVLGGGRLVLALGDTWEPAARTFLADFIPGRLAGLETTGDLESLAALGSEPFEPSDRMVVACLADSSGRVLAHAGKWPLIVTRRMGFGEVIFLAFDPTKRPFAQWRGNTAFWDHVFQLRRLPAEEPSSASRNWYYRESLRSSLLRSLSSFPEVRPVSFVFVIFFLLGYVLLIGPVDYFVLKKLRHLEWTWFTFPATALVATLLAFWVISSSRVVRTYINHVAVADWSADGRAQRSHDLSVLLSPANAVYDVTFRMPGSDMYLYEPERRDFRMGPTLNLARQFVMRDTLDAGPTISRLPIPVWSTRSFCAVQRGPRDVRAPVEASLRLADGVLHGSVTNVGDRRLTDVVVLHRSGVYRLGAIEPGAAAPGSTVPFSRGRVGLDAWAARIEDGRVSYDRDNTGSSGRAEADSLISLATLGRDRRFFPAHYYQTRAQNYGHGMDFAPEWSLRAAIEEGQAVITGLVSEVEHPLQAGVGNALRWNRTLYRVCVEVQ